LHKTASEVLDCLFKYGLENAGTTLTSLEYYLGDSILIHIDGANLKQKAENGQCIEDYLCDLLINN